MTPFYEPCGSARGDAERANQYRELLVQLTMRDLLLRYQADRHRARGGLRRHAVIASRCLFGHFYSCHAD